MDIKKEITESDCDLWNKNKNINPHTKRAIKSTSSIYKKFHKQCSNKKSNEQNDKHKELKDERKKLKDERKKLKDERKKLKDKLKIIKDKRKIQKDIQIKQESNERKIQKDIQIKQESNEQNDKHKELKDERKKLKDERKKLKDKRKKLKDERKKLKDERKKLKDELKIIKDNERKIQKDIQIKQESNEHRIQKDIQIKQESNERRIQKDIKIKQESNERRIQKAIENTSDELKKQNGNFFSYYMPSFFTRKKDSSPIDNDLHKINDKTKILIDYFISIIIKKNNCLELTKHKNIYLLADNILLYNQFGTESKYGIIYKSKNINDHYKNIPEFVSKVQLSTAEAKNEYLIFKVVSDYGLKYNICNFPVLYFFSNCDKIIRDSNYPDNISKATGHFKNYTIMLYELADGDLISFINKYRSKITSKQWKNIYEQTFMSIYIYHFLGFRHNDTHSGNFLYTKIKPGGCFHYNINDVDYYIENIGYKWMIWDYGISKVFKNENVYIYDDYSQIFASFIHNKPGIGKSGEGEGFLNPYIILPKDIKKLQNEIWEHLGGANKYGFRMQYIHFNNFTESDWIKYFLDKNLLFSKVPIGDIISSSKLKKEQFKIKFVETK
jgi:hypothetical protein